ncbi:helix-turn-helix domain-containing protein [Bacillus cereus]|uniref:helix-turn-helix domain-containing protein n=1 Tax=Bacillus cereus TaxID=1396 RepID=UPI000BECFE65|nr:helix-turn-helix transcriptional regulator [Bacillus cereus]PEE49796.1 hypothetical protein COM80_29200 [Bacillus cereus]PFV63365.1 hypothetical protein COL16_29050 [Bacillus cereus]PGY68875.1 hypothetical protein COE34_16325 [Bacillus cereus]
MIFTLGKTLDELKITKNKLAVEAKIRPNTISNLVSGDVNSIRMDTLQSIIDTLNVLAEENGIEKIYGIKDVVIHEEDAK